MITDTDKGNIGVELKRIVGDENVYENEPMRDHTTFKIGGEADFLVTPETIEQVTELLKFFKESETAFFFMGNGSNLLVSDDGFRGVAVKLLDDFAGVTFDGEDDKGMHFTAKAGTRMWRLGMFLLEHEATGFEFGTGIPGTVGGAVMMNAGAYGGEMKDVVESVLVADRDGNVKRLSNEEMDFSYRHSAVSDNGYIVLEAVLCLKKGDKQEIRAGIDALTEKRRTKQPLDMPSAGSTFKRPEGYYAAQLIDEAGFRGRTVGGAAVSEKHAGFVINKGGATAEDVVALTDEIKRVVMERTGVELELEVRKIGF